MSAQKTTIDWLRFRVQAEPREALEALKPMFGDLGSMMRLEGLQRGMLGFKQAVSINVADMIVGRMDFGGDSQRGWVRVDMPGKGCEWVQDWDAVQGVEELPSAQIRRLDVALTTWDGEVTHETVLKAHQEGRFITRGRPPALQQITSSDPRAGRTCNVGKREKSDKFFRAYEKGYQLAAKVPFVVVSQIDGKNVEDIYRCELELKAESTDIPWDVIERRDQYFAGAYPFCADILPGVEADILMRRPDRKPQTDLSVALAHLKAQWGPTLYTALMAYQGDMTAVWDKVVGDFHSQPLIEAGVLLVDHD
jgi:phage replication initiation protein